MVAVQLREILRDLTLPEGVVERVVDQLRRDAVPGRLIAVDVERERGALALLVGRDVAQLRQALQLRQDLGRPRAELVEIGVLQRVLELRARGAAADGHVLRGLQEQLRAFDRVELLPQAGDDLVRVGVALARAASA